MLYHINADRTKPWNDLPDLPISQELYEDVEIYKQLGNSKAALGRLQGRSIAIPNQGLLINSISLQEAKASSAVENIFTTDDELYKAYSEQDIQQLKGPAKEILFYREALWTGHKHLLEGKAISRAYFVKMYKVVTGFGDGMRPPISQTVIKEGGTGPNARRCSILRQEVLGY